jgi:hypothetical protein
LALTKKQLRRIVVDSMLPYLDGFVEADATALRWPPHDSMVHYFRPRQDVDGLGLTLSAHARPIALPTAVDGGLVTELGLWRPVFDASAPPDSFFEAIDRGLEFFTMYASPETAYATMGFQLRGQHDDVWRWLRRTPVAAEPVPGASFLEVYGIVAVLAGETEVGREALERSLAMTRHRFDEVTNPHIRRLREQRQSRIESLIQHDSLLQGIEQATQLPGEPQALVREP